MGCLAGGLAIYLIGMGLFDSVGLWLLETFNYTQQFQSFQVRFTNNAFWVILMVGVTPIPFQVAALTSGAAEYPWYQFLLAAGVARGVRYYGLAAIVWWKGDQAQTFIQRHKKTSIVIGVVVIGGGWAMMKLL
jgi:membrane protein YqaA with SNARE-associated domain